MSKTARDLERWWSEVNAKGIVSIVYPALWLTPFLSVVLVTRAISANFALDWRLAAGMAVIIELLGVTTGHNGIESRGKVALLAWGLFAAYVLSVSLFIALADGALGLVFPALSVVAILTANLQVKRQVRRDEQQGAKRERQEPAKPEQITVEQVPQLPAPAPALSKGELVAAYLSAHIGATDEQVSEATGIPRSTVGYHRRRIGSK